MPKEPSLPSHPTEDLLELFVLGRLKPRELIGVEEHLLLCTECQESVEEIEAFVSATRRAAAELPGKIEKPSHGSQSFFGSPFPFAVAVIAALLLLVTAMAWQGRQTPQTIDLAALRGSSSVTTARANSPIELHLDVTGMSGALAYTVELVDGHGIVRWDQPDIPPAGSRLTAMVPKALNPGQYFVRVYSNSLKSELLKEYSLRVQ